MSWSLLTQHLQSWPKTQSREFEVLLATLLSELLEARFAVARAGTQPSGDVRSWAGDISIQAKNYADGTKVDLTNLEGEISRACDHCPMLDVFIIAVSRQDAQLLDTADRLQRKFGVDVVPLELSGDEISDLGALCAGFWRSIKELPIFKDCPVDLKEFLSAQSQGEEVLRRLAQLPSFIGEGLRSWAWYHATVKRQCEERFGHRDTIRRFGNAINLSSAVNRPRYSDALRQWWDRCNNRVLRIQGEEGIGKTWLAARFAEGVVEQETNAVLWFDSNEWNRVSTVRGLLDAGMARFEPNANLRTRMVHKALHRWRGHHLLVLDGANERDALTALSTILADFFDHPETHGAINILVTTRPVEQSPGFCANLWDNCEPLIVEGYDDEELREAMSSAGMSLKATDLSSLEPLIRVPRYFEMCVRLRHQFDTESILTRELLLWEDLKQKIVSRNWQVVDDMKIESPEDAEELLARLAQELPAGKEDGAPVEANLLQAAFDRPYIDIRRQLTELRVLTMAKRYKASLSSDHVRLCWALYLKQVTEQEMSGDLLELVDAVRAALEPMPDCDLRVQALFVALTLLASPHKQGHPGLLTRQRAGLLFCWANSQNAALSENRLRFLLQTDLAAYLLTIEHLHIGLSFHGVERGLNEGLARYWRQCSPDGGPYAELCKYFQRWLLLCSPLDAQEGQEAVTWNGHELPIARSVEQLRLSNLAVSLISLNPQFEFLGDLALALATRNVSQAEVEGRERPRPLKLSLESHIGLLMRWTYGHDAIPYLAALAEDSVRGGPLHQAVMKLTWMIGEENLPSALAEAKDWVTTRRSLSTAENLKWHAVLLYPPERGNRVPLDAGALAVWSDLPQEDDRVTMRELAEQQRLEGWPSGQQAEFEKEELRQLRPWIHRLFPETARDLDLQLLKEALRAAKIKPFLHDLSSLMLSIDTCEDADREELHEQLAALLDHFTGQDQGTPVFELELLWLLATFLESEDGFVRLALRYWVSENATLTLSRVLKSLAPEQLEEYARLEAHRLTEQLEGGDASFDLEAFTTTCQLWEVSLRPPCEDAFEMALQALSSEKLPERAIGELFELMGAAGIHNGFKRLLQNQRAKSLLTRENLRKYLWQWPEDTQVSLELPHQMLQELFSDECARDWLGVFAAERPESHEFWQWGDELSQLANILVEQTSVFSQGKSATAISLDQNGVVVIDPLVTPVAPVTDSPDSGNTGRSGQSVGIADSESILGAVSQMGPSYESNEVDLRKWAGFPFHAFGAIRQFWKWAETHPEQFLQRAALYTEKMPRSMIPLLHMHSYTFALLGAMVPTQPGKAYEVLNSIHNRGTLKITSAEMMVLQRFWEPAFADSAEHALVRKQMLHDCSSDEELLAVAVIALQSKGGSILEGLCELLLEDDDPATRNLALSILPWIASQRAVDLIHNTAQNDSNRWVREHASWAYKAVQQEVGCRSIYREALSKDDREGVWHMLNVIEMARTPTARYWSRKVESELRNETWRNDRRLRAMLKFYWQHWLQKSRSKENVEICGRKLSDYCRGERLSRGLYDRMSPWWRV